MDPTLLLLIEQLQIRMKELRDRNPEINMDDLLRSCALIDSYKDGFIEELSSEPVVSDTVISNTSISYEDICKSTRPPRIIPVGNIGASPEMIRYAKRVDTMNARCVDDIIALGKQLSSQKPVPFFP